MASVPTNSFQRRLQHANNINRTSKSEDESHALILKVIDGETADGKDLSVLEGITSNWRNYTWAEVAIMDKRHIARFKQSSSEVLALYGNSAQLIGRTAKIKYSDGLTNILIVGLFETKPLVNPNRVNFIYDIGI